MIIHLQSEKHEKSDFEKSSIVCGFFACDVSVGL